MLLLLFQLGESRYAIDTADVVEIVPTVLLTKIAAVPAHIAGVFNYHNIVTPVVDLCQIIQGTSCQVCYSTRIVIVNAAAESRDRSVAARPLGLMAERVTETLKIDVNFPEIPQRISTASYLGEPFFDEQGMIQQVYWQHLISEAQQATGLMASENQVNGAGRN